MRQTISILALLLLSLPVFAQWKTADTPWPESFGSQRAVIEVGKACDVAEITVEWRRHDRDVANRRFLIVNRETGDTIENISRISVTPESCTLRFGPVNKAGRYDFYYLPFQVQEGWGFYGRGYLKPEGQPDPKWNAQSQNPGNIFNSKVISIESRTGFDSFFPMEIIPTPSEIRGLLAKYPGPVLLFPESRENPIRMNDQIPMKWAKSGPAGVFTGKAARNEYFPFQIGVYAASADIEGLEVSFSDCPVPVTCFNTEGTDPHGKTFKKKLNVAKGKVQALWIGVDIPQDFKPGMLTGIVRVKAANMAEKPVKFQIEVTPDLLADRGDSEPWRYSRLRWLNSTAGSEGDPIAPYKAIKPFKINAFEVAFHRVTLASSGLPEKIEHQENDILNRPAMFQVVVNKEPLSVPFQVTKRELTEGKYVQTAVGSAGPLKITIRTQLEYDGYVRYAASVDYLGGTEDPPFLNVEDIRLDLPMEPGRARFMMGMGLPGTSVPLMHTAKWKGPYDSFWIGDPEGGLWCELRGSSYHGPLLNLYKPQPPVAWNNEGNGGFSILPENGATVARVFSGPRTLRLGDRINFEWAILITPVKPVNYQSQFLNRYYHSGAQPTPGPADFDAGVKVINVHHANKFNPFINWPFIAVKEMTGFTDSVHQLGKKVKIYYTVRELTNHVGELWALRSLGNEILGEGSGGGYPWLREHLIDGYTPQWYQHFPDGQVDASILSAPGDSRWLNYYIEGLAWLVKNVDIDGLYLDDVTYDRSILKRMRTVMSRLKPDCMIDLHSNTGFSIGPATQYAEFFPFVDKLWFGESFQYDRMPPENWLVETSGIPFGLMGDMLQGGGNRWLGMLFGMTVRLPWSTEGVLCDPKPVWKIWDQFAIHDAKMIGFWENDMPVTTGCPEVKATVYVKPDKLLISLGNFSDQNQEVSLTVDWKAIGWDPSAVRLWAPEIENFQSARDFSPSEKILVEPRKGWLIYVER
jgi:hypothetical protein